MLKLAQALRLQQENVIAFVGSGGKTSALFQAAHELAPALVTASTHLGTWQASLADQHITCQPGEPLPGMEAFLTGGVTLVTGPQRSDAERLTAPTPAQLESLRQLAAAHGLPLLIEADGARQKPLKAPGEREPAIPPFADVVVVVAGLSGLGQPLSKEHVFRAETFGALGGLGAGETIRAGALARALIHPQGGLKNIPPDARRIALLNQADSPELQSRAGRLAKTLLAQFDAVVITCLEHKTVYTAQEPIAGIVLAAGGSSRYGGQPKQLLDFRGETFIHRVARTALAAGLAPVVVVSGANAEAVEAAVNGLPVVIARNERWQDGQASSVRTGLAALHSSVGGAVFLLTDQPQVTPQVLEALVNRHAQGLFPAVLPLVAGQRGNPALFDRVTFDALLALQGDSGGRAVFQKFPLEYLPWHDESLLFDVDNEADYRKLLAWGMTE